MVTLEELKPTWRDGLYLVGGALLDRFGINYAIKKSKAYIDQSMDQAADRVAERLNSKISAQKSEEKLYRMIEDLSSKVAGLENELRERRPVDERN